MEWVVVAVVVLAVGLVVLIMRRNRGFVQQQKAPELGPVEKAAEDE